MSDWDSAARDLALALPGASSTGAPPVAASQASGQEAQNTGAWGEKVAYDYDRFNLTTKEATDRDVANGIESGDWASNAPIYEFNDEYGDVGPEFADLEEQLFGGVQQQKGINYSKIASIEVTQEGTVRIQPSFKFGDAGLHPVMAKNVKLAGYDVPTPIQAYVLPAIFKGYDVIASAQTGSGKTAAFLIPIISKLMGKAKKLAAWRPNPATFQLGITPPVRAEPLVLIVCPSRELATQIFNEARKFCYRSMLRPVVVYGGGPLGEQIQLLAKGCDILIGTPGRLVDLISRPHILTLSRLKFMVIDEADEMLQSDWEQELKIIMSGGDQEEGNIKYLMFSATFPKVARELATQHLAHDHVRIRVGRAGSSHVNIKQDVVFVRSEMKRTAIRDLLINMPPTRTMIFVNSKRTADELDDYLFNLGFPCASIHSDRTQREREDTIRAFRKGAKGAGILICTGVSARGLDVAKVMHVINYDLPSTQFGGIEEYTHRIGRTGRIGNMGLATSFYNDRDEDLAPSLVKTLLETGQVIPDFLANHIPEGFTADGTGDVTTLKFDADSDDEAEDVTEPGGGWGADTATSGWGTSDPTAPAPATSGWGSSEPLTTPLAPGFGDPDPITVPSTATAPTASNWGTAAAPVSQISAASGWGSSAVTAAPTNNGWDAPDPAPASKNPSNNGWGSGGGAAW